MLQNTGGSRPDDVFDEPRSGRLVAWGNAWLNGATSPDHAADGIRGTDDRHAVEGVDGADGAGLTLALGRLRALGATGLRLALPTAGHPLGLTGPAGFNQQALAVGEAVLTVGAPLPLGLVPEVVGHGPEGDRLIRVLWRAAPVEPGVPADVPQLRDAERELAEALREATALLMRLDVAGGGPAVQRALEAYRRRREPELLAPGYPPRAVRVLQSARQVRALLALAAVDHGAAVSAGEMTAREAAMRPLGRAARRATVAAYNAMVDEPAREER
ncbi:hypothetical protein [Streptacidiphilus cavernicola]|uniref:Acyl-CoA dehydrogenase/oxidase C-terminal domain-containing protein n=1 Tax=Streptacidiphilus cavernicola TaxID=3342716 RepID=A0ABV6W107_9ACTN